MLALRDWQQQLQHAILDGDTSEDLLREVRRFGVIAQQRIGVYRDAYFLRLAEALASNYPAIALYMGEPDFTVLAQAYTTAYPSATRRSAGSATGWMYSWVRRHRGRRIRCCTNWPASSGRCATPWMPPMRPR
ncbi:MAG: putative DNA-binding domain-containing protein [Haliea sp.]|nr:putative DNA-binding domain-containing protein [Haliea sp.]